VRHVQCPSCRSERAFCYDYETVDGDSYNTYTREEWHCRDCGFEFQIEARWQLTYFSYAEGDSECYIFDPDDEIEIKR